MMRYDVAIIGAGPAGTTLARLLGQRYRVLLVDRRGLDAPPVAGRAEKCCGGLLAPQAQAALAAQGLTPPPSVLTAAQPETVRVFDADNGLSRDFARPYLNCDRARLDRWLLSLAADSVEMRCGTSLQEIAVDEDGVTLQLLSQGRRHCERARILVGADGASSLVRRRLFPSAPSTHYLAVQEWFAPRAPWPAHLAIFDRMVTDFYGWAVVKDGLLAIGAALRPHAYPHTHFAALLTRLAAAGFDPGQRCWREGAWVRRPLRNSDLCLGDGRILLVGEAAGWINPSSAEGLSYAFRSAAALAEALNDGIVDALRRYTAHTAPLRRTMQRERLRASAMSTPWLRGIALRAQREVTIPIQNRQLAYELGG